MCENIYLSTPPTTITMGSGSSKNRKISKDIHSENVKSAVKTIGRFAKHHKEKLTITGKDVSENGNQAISNSSDSPEELNSIGDQNGETRHITKTDGKECNTLGEGICKKHSRTLLNPPVFAKTDECNVKTLQNKPSTINESDIERRKSLQKFVETMKGEKESIYAELANNDIAPEQFRLRPETAKSEERITRDTDKDLLSVVNNCLLVQYIFLRHELS